MVLPPGPPSDSGISTLSSPPMESLRTLSLSLLLLSLSSSCRSATEYAEEADADVYALLQARRAELELSPSAFTIDPPDSSLRQRILAGEVDAERAYNLLDCLEIAAENSRSMQDRKESLYMAALDVTLERWDLGWIPDADGDATLRGTGNNGDSIEGGFSAGLDRVLGSGARVVAGIGLSMFRLIGSGDGVDFTSDVSLSVTQPLLRGFGSRFTLEPLTQAERDLVYEVRRFESFRRDLAIDVSNRIYRILQQADTVQNERDNLKNLQILRERNQALSEAGRLSDIQVDQARQDELRSTDRLIGEIEQLEGQLDDFLIFLGLPPGVPFNVDPAELEQLVEVGPASVDVPEATAVQRALDTRLDHLTALDRIEDAERHLLVAEDALRAGLSLTADASLSSDEGRPASFDLDEASWSLGVLLDLPVSRLPQRNSYRRSLISRAVSSRSQEELADNITADIRADLRETRTTLEAYQIQLNSVSLAARRIYSAYRNPHAAGPGTCGIHE